MATAAYVVAAIAAIGGAREQNIANKEQKKQNRIAAKAAALRNARSRRQDIAKARRLRAQSVAQAESQGVSGGSSAAQAAGSIQTQAAANASFSQQLQQLDQQNFNASQKVSNATGRGRNFEAVDSIARSFI